MNWESQQVGFYGIGKILMQISPTENIEQDIYGPKNNMVLVIDIEFPGTISTNKFMIESLG
jgi:hypothetical protein